MKIERIDLYHISQPLVSEFVTSFGPQRRRDSLILAVHAEGLTGWGECVATNTPGYSYETVQTAWHILTDFLIPIALERTLNEPEEVPEWFAPVRGHPLAKAALEQAAWDLTAQRDGLSFAQKLAQPYEEEPRAEALVGVSIGIQPTVVQTLSVIEAHLIEGYGRIKLKIKPGHDLKLARAAAAAFPDIPIMLDANSAYTLDDVPLFQAMDELGLLMLEQPLGHDDLYDHSRLRAQIETPLCLDESIVSFDHARAALALGACDIINVKPARVSGWTEARRIHDLCRKRDIPLWVGGMLETGVGRAGQLALAALPGFTLHGDISATDRYYNPDITEPFYLKPENSTLRVPEGPGLGVKVDESRLEKATLRRESHTA